MNFYSMEGRRLQDLVSREEEKQIEGMGCPVRCTFCGRVYDLWDVHVTQRYADCSVWKTPCCNHEADDRVWPGRAHFTKIERKNREK